MEDVVELLEDIGEFISSLFGFVTDFIGDLLYMIELVGKTVAAIPSYLSWLPGEVVAIFVTIFGVVVIYKIIGREG